MNGDNKSLRKRQAGDSSSSRSRDIASFRLVSDPVAAASDAHNSNDYLLFSTVTPDFGDLASGKVIAPLYENNAHKTQQERRRLHSGITSTMMLRGSPQNMTEGEINSSITRSTTHGVKRTVKPTSPTEERQETPVFQSTKLRKVDQGEEDETFEMLFNLREQ